MGMEHGEREPLHAESDAAGMCSFASGILDVPSDTEMVAMIVEAHAGGRLLFPAPRHKELEFQRLLFLAHCLHLADAAEEGIARLVDLEGKAKVARDALRAHHPALAERGNVIRAADADIFAHPKRLQPVEMPRRLAAEAIGSDVEAQSAEGQLPAACGNRIDWIEGGRGGHEGGRRP